MRTIAIRGLLEPIRKIIEHDRGEFTVTRVGQPDASGNVGAWLVAPQGPRRQVRRPRRLRQDVDESRRLISPDSFGLRGLQHLGAPQSCRRRRTISLQTIAFRLRWARSVFGGGRE